MSLLLENKFILQPQIEKNNMTHPQPSKEVQNTAKFITKRTTMT